MARRSKKVFYKRKWLNKPGYQSHGHVIAEVFIDPPDGKFRGEVDASFSIMDCSRLISLSFNTYDRERNNSLAKARLLEQLVTEFVDALYKADADLMELREQWKQGKK